MPSSKSILHRGLICAALAPGKSVIHRLYLSRDIQATMDCLTALGASFTRQGDDVLVEGISSPVKSAALPCGESGSTLRFLIPVAAALGVDASFTGQGRLVTRPLTAYDGAFVGKGVHWHNTGTLPCSVSGKLEPGNYEIDGSQSSQFISGLLFALPLLKGDSTLTVTGSSSPKAMWGLPWGVERVRHCRNPDRSQPLRHSRRTGLSGRGVHRRKRLLPVCLLSLRRRLGGKLTLRSFSPDSLQGDKPSSPFWSRSGSPPNFRVMRSAQARQVKTLYGVCRGCSGFGAGTVRTGQRLRGGKPDLSGGTAENQGKRPHCFHHGLVNGLGGGMEYLPQEDCIRITGKGYLEGGGVIPCENDHRIAMSGGVAAAICQTPFTLLGAECVANPTPPFGKTISV